MGVDVAFAALVVVKDNDRVVSNKKKGMDFTRKSTRRSRCGHQKSPEVVRKANYVYSRNV